MSSHFAATVLAPIVERRNAGADEVQLHNELLRAVLPWVRVQVASNVRRIPSNADAATVSSLMHEAAYQAVTRLDWDKWQAWPMYLAALVRRAGQEAARRDDYLSRQHRVLRTRFNAACVELENRLGGPVDERRRRSVALEIAAGRPELAEVLLIGWHPKEMGQVPDDASSDSVVEEIVEREMVCRGVRVWLEQDVPDDVRAMVTVWLKSPRSQSLPARVERLLKPYVAKLLESIDDAAFDEFDDLAVLAG